MTTIKPLILAVDDSPQILQQIHGLLSEDYQVMIAKDGETALTLVERREPDLILLDIVMPGMSGYDVCEKLKANPSTQHIPIIFVSSQADDDDQEKGFALGAADYISKPFSPNVTFARIKTHLQLKEMTDFLRDQNTFLEAEVSKRTDEIKSQSERLQALQQATILIVTSLAETRDLETGNHIRRTQFFIEAIAQELVESGEYSDELSADMIAPIVRSAPLHDIGKVGIPDAILTKRGKLTDAEYEVMKSHAQLGLDAIERAEKQLGIQVDFLQHAKEIAVGHHEKWNGSGYPKGIAGRDIPISARLMAIADVYDALINQRCYKPAIEHTKSVEIMKQGYGTHFDPVAFDAFLRCEQRIIQIAHEYRDDEDPTETLESLEWKT
jgi:putative two-component system response regulator